MSYFIFVFLLKLFNINFVSFVILRKKKKIQYSLGIKLKLSCISNSVKLKSKCKPADYVIFIIHLPFASINSSLINLPLDFIVPLIVNVPLSPGYNGVNPNSSCCVGCCLQVIAALFRFNYERTMGSTTFRCVQMIQVNFVDCL